MLSTTDYDEISGVDQKIFKKIYAIGIGGAGGNMITDLMRMKVNHVECIAVNTDGIHLNEKCEAHKKLLIGYEITGGTGSGGKPNIGRIAAEKSIDKINGLLNSCKNGLIFITAGMGGGTGTGASPVIARIAKQKGAIVVAVVTMPFQMEGMRTIVAKQGIKELRKYADTVIVIDNEKLAEVAGTKTVKEAFAVASNLLGRMIKAIADAAFGKGLVNVDFADVKTVMKQGRVAMIGYGKGTGDNRVKKAIKDAVNNPLLEVDITTATAALIYVIGGEDITLDEIREAGNMIANEILPNAFIRWGVQIEGSKRNEVEIILILTGVKSSSLLSPLEEIETIDESVLNSPLYSIKSIDDRGRERERIDIKRIFDGVPEI